VFLDGDVVFYVIQRYFFNWLLKRPPRSSYKNCFYNTRVSPYPCTKIRRVNDYTKTIIRRRPSRKRVDLFFKKRLLLKFVTAYRIRVIDEHSSCFVSTKCVHAGGWGRRGSRKINRTTKLKIGRRNRRRTRRYECGMCSSRNSSRIPNGYQWNCVAEDNVTRIVGKRPK